MSLFQGSSVITMYSYNELLECTVDILGESSRLSI